MQETVWRLTISVLFLLVGYAGCAATVKSPPALSGAPPEDVLQSLRTIAVIAGTLPHEATLTARTPVGEAARIGATQGAKNTFAYFTGVCLTPTYYFLLQLVACPVAGAALTPIGAGVGAVIEATRAESSATVAAVPGLVFRLLTEEDVPGALRDRVSALGNEWTRWRQWRFVALADGGPGTPEGAAPALVDRGVDTVLQVNVERVGLAGTGTRINPPLALVMTVKTRLLRVPDLDVLHESSLTWESIDRSLDEWGARDGGRLREEIRRAARGLADRIVDEVFLLFPPLENVASVDVRIVSERIKFLRDGATARQEILDRLGEPIRRYEGGRVLTYLMYRDHRGQLRPSPPPAHSSARYHLVLMFGRDDRLEAHRLVQLDQ